MNRFRVINPSLPQQQEQRNMSHGIFIVSDDRALIIRRMRRHKKLVCHHKTVDKYRLARFNRIFAYRRQTSKFGSKTN